MSEREEPPVDPPPTNMPTGKADDGALGLDWETEDRRYTGDGGGADTPATDSSKPGTSPKSSDAPPPPRFYDLLRRVENEPRWNCTLSDGEKSPVEGACRADRTVCNSGPSYSINSGEILAVPGSGSRGNPGDVTYESITRDTKTGTDSSNGFRCRQPLDSAPRGNAGATPAGE